MQSRSQLTKLSRKFAQVRWRLIKGVAYLHKNCIAHRDIKPENLVVDWNLCLKIIDFDVAMKVNDEDEVVDGQCGTKGWMAPEMEEKSMYSPIKADRWSTGKVLCYLLNKFRKENTALSSITRKLTARNPQRRSSMIQVAASFSLLDVANVAVERKAWRPLQDTVEVDGENAKSPRVKKQKPSVLSVPGRTRVGRSSCVTSNELFFFLVLVTINPANSCSVPTCPHCNPATSLKQRTRASYSPTYIAEIGQTEDRVNFYRGVGQM